MIDLDELPAGWTKEPLAKVTEPSKEKVDPTSVPHATYIGLEHIEARTRRIVGRGVGADVKSAKVVFRAGDVLYGKLRPYLNKVAVPDFDGIASTDILVFPPSPQITSAYLARMLNSSWFVEQAHQSSTGMELPRTSWKALSRLDVPVPPIALQRALTELLDQVDDHREKAAGSLARARRALSDFRQAVLATAVTGRLTEDWRNTADVTDVQAWLDSLPPAGSRNKSSRARGGSDDSVDERFESLPASWLPVRLGDVFDVGTGATPLRRNKAYYGHGTVPWVTSGAVNAGLIREPNELITELALAETSAKIFPAGTLLVAMYGEGQTRGRVAELGIDAATNQAVAAILVAECPDHLRQYLRIFFEDNYRRLRSLAFGGVQPNLSLGVIKDMVLPLPPKEEQAEIVRRVNALLSGGADVGARIEHATTLLDKAGEAALARAFRGELVA